MSAQLGLFDGAAPEAFRIEWGEPYEGGRFGRVLEAEEPLSCAACDYKRDLWPTSKHQAGALVWESADGVLMHYRCAPSRARFRWRVALPRLDRYHPNSPQLPYPTRSEEPVQAIVHGVAGLWLFSMSAWYLDPQLGSPLVEWRPILWRRFSP